MSAGTYRETLKRQGLQPFLWTQFLGAFNDNLFKIVVSMLAVHRASASGGGGDLSLVGAIFILPFLLFSGYAGQLEPGIRSLVLGLGYGANVTMRLAHQFLTHLDISISKGQVTNMVA